jgi:dienelactone hydrolase
MQKPYLFGIITIAAILALTAIVYLRFFKSNINVKKATSPEQLVFARSSDGILNAGEMFSAKKTIAQPIAIIWVHGWGVNFYSPTYVSIGRSLAEKGYTSFTVNTRMHDLGNIEGYKGDKRLRGGGYWGVGSDQTKDIVAWVDFAEANGFKKVVLVGHSAGCAAVRVYQAEKQDRRVIGLVFGSGGVNEDGVMDSLLVHQAIRLNAEGKGDALVEDTKRSFPSYTSAATIIDIVNTPSDYSDFFGVRSDKAGITKIQCPILAFYGVNEEGWNESDLELLKTSIKKHPKGPVSVTTTMITGADHMYTGEENQVADVITGWLRSISK